MTMTYLDLHRQGRLLVPSRLSDIDGLLMLMEAGAPTMQDRTGQSPYQNLESRFFQLTQGLENVRNRLNSEDYVDAVDFARRAEALFAGDPDDSNGNTTEGITLLTAIHQIVERERQRRYEGGLPDDDGDVTGD